MSPKPKITAILPVYNDSAFLARTLTSLKRQTLKGMEIIVIDDASNTDNLNLIRFYMKKNKNIRLVSLEKRMGAAYCRNLGNTLALSDIIMVCDTGDVNHIERAKDAYNFLKQRKDIDVYSSVCIVTNHLDENVEVHFPRIFNDKEKPSLFHPTVVYRKKVTEKIKYREGNLATDQYEVFFFEAYRAGFKFWFTTEAMVKKLKQGKSVENAKLRIEQRIKNYKEFNITV